jgi:putative acetyltransferase
MVVRRMRPEDVSEIHAIHTECLSSRTLREWYTDEQLAAWLSGRTPEGYLRACASGEHFLVAEQEGAVVGFASWQDDELLALFVHPDEQVKRELAPRYLSPAYTMPPPKEKSS